MSAAGGEFIPVATLDEVPPGAMKFVEAGGMPVVLCNVDGTIYAVGNVCTHDDGPLAGGTLDGNEIECPRHGARFDVRDGHVVCLPAAMPVPAYQVKVEGQQIKVKVT